MRFQGFIGPSYTNVRSKNIDCQRCINLYPERNSGLSKENEVASLLATPGLRLLLTFATSPGRGIYTASNGRVFAVAGAKFYEVTVSGGTFSSTERGTIVSTTGRVSMVDNGIDLFLVDGTSAGYTFTFGSNTFSTVADGDFYGADRVDFLDGYFVFNKRNTGQFYWTDLNATTFDGLDFTTSEASPDNVVTLAAFRGELVILNEQTSEIFYDSGDANNTFARVNGGRMNVGCAAKHSVASDDDNLFWLGKSKEGAGIVYTLQGQSPERISTHAVEQAIQGYSDISDAEGYCYQQEGHSFYVLNFPTADTTWVFDKSTGFWHERAYMNDGEFERHRANAHAYGLETHLVTDYANGKLYALETDYYSDDGEEIVRERIAPHISTDSKRFKVKSLTLEMEYGVGLDGATTLQGNNPQVMLQWSKDGGHTWSSEIWKDVGRIGVRSARAKFNRLGLARDLVIKVRITDPVKVALIGASIEPEGLAS